MDPCSFDNLLMTPNGRVHRLLTRLATEHLFHPFQPFIFGQKSLAPKMSALYKIPLVFYGESEAEYGNPKADMRNSFLNWAHFTANDAADIYLGGTSIKELTEDFGIDPVELQPYLPADPKKLDSRHFEVHYLGYYLKWHPCVLLCSGTWRFSGSSRADGWDLFQIQWYR